MLPICLILHFTFILRYIACFGEEQTEEKEVCYDEVGCFSQTAPWVTPLRHFPAPRSPGEINVTMYLMTRNTLRNTEITNLRVRESPLHVNPTSLRTLNFVATRPTTVFIIHGFNADVNSTWMTEMAEVYLSKIDANVFLVDWGDGARKANYLQVAANTRVVGVIVAKFLTYLINNERLQPYNVHMIGHSLGAHACGYVGKQVNRIFRITGLDVAQPGFEGFDAEVRLTSNDALYLDAIHTNAKPTVPTFGLGYISSLGDVDFYFNGGAHQPGCLTEPLTTIDFPATSIIHLPVEVISEYLSCSHSKSIHYFIEAMSQSSCIMWGHKENLINRVLNLVTLGRMQKVIGSISNQCTLSTCSPVGLETFRYPGRGKFFVTTNVKPEYCIQESRNTRIMIQNLNDYYRTRGK